MEKSLKILGVVCLTLGITTVIVSYYSLKLGIPVGFLGMVLSSIYVFLDTKHQINKRSLTLGIIGMLLSSTPVLIIIAIIAYNYFYKQ